jgi:RNA polymerase sigma factor (TIGR02999 family)
LLDCYPDALADRERAAVTNAGSAEITRLLAAWRGGDGQALEQLLPLVYAELRRIAHRRLRASSAPTLSATDLVHEAYLKLLGPSVDWQNRAHFFAIVARQMRQILVDRARYRQRAKRGGGAPALTLSQEEPADQHAPLDVLLVDQLLTQLATVDERKRDVLELHYFGGLSHLEMSHALGVSEATVDRDLRFAKAWLRKAMSA